MGKIFRGTHRREISSERGYHGRIHIRGMIAHLMNTFKASTGCLHCSGMYKEYF